MINTEAYINFMGELRVCLTSGREPSVRQVANLSRSEAERLAADLIRALSTSDRAVAADSGMHVDDRSSRITPQGHYDPWL